MRASLARPHALSALVIAATLGAACAARRVPAVAPEPVGLIVLLPDPVDNTVGRATVSNASTTVELNGAYQATRVAASRPPSPVTTMEKAEVERLFHDVLASLPPPPRHFTLYFEFGSDELTAASRAFVAEVLQVVKDRPAADVIVVGHTDTTGTAASNYELGLRRAAIVRDLLITGGLDAAAVEVTSHGEGDPLVPTRDDVNEARNRRVEIDIQ